MPPLRLQLTRIMPQKISRFAQPLNRLATITGEKSSGRNWKGLVMNREDVMACKEHIVKALCVMEREADTQPEVHVLICLRELLDDIEWLESFGEHSENVVRLADVKHLRDLGGVRLAD